MPNQTSTYRPSEAVIDVAATARLTRLVIEDEITRELREKAFLALQKIDHPISAKLQYLLTCPWCVSIYAGAALLTLRVISPSTAKIVNTALAASQVTGMAAEKYGL